MLESQGSEREMVGVGGGECEDWWERGVCVVCVSRKIRPMLRLPIFLEGSIDGKC